MSRLFKGFTLNEGYTDLGTLSVDITFLESEIIPQVLENNKPKTNTSLLFRLVNDTSENPLPGLEVNYSIAPPIGDYLTIVSQQFSSSEGYVEFVVPQIATYLVSNNVRNIINYKIEGEVEDRQDECYLEVRDSGNNPFYTLYRQFAFEIISGSRYLGVQNADGSEIYTLYPQISIPSTISAVFISDRGEVFGYTNSTDTWALIDSILFTQFSNPAGLNFVTDWFYETSGTSGTITTGKLGDGSFSAFSFKGLNPVPVLIDIAIEIPNPEGGADLYDSTLQLLPGDQNIHILELDYSPAAPDDDTPTTGDVETAAGITFSGPFQTFLTANNLDTVQAIRRAGPLKYITGIPDPEASEVATLQSYVDLYFLTYFLPACTSIISAGYNSVYDIAMVPRSVFIQDIGVTGEFVFATAKAHETAVKRVALISNVLAASLNDNQLSKPVNYAGSDSPAYSVFVPSCNCDDCKSGISPFAYLSDLIRYSAAHVIKTGTGAYTPVDYSAFLTLIQNTFFQPFGDYPVDCDTLHEEFCRVRLATEVLLALYNQLVSEDEISAGKQATYLIQKNQYLQLTYNTLLLQMGTTFDEVRSVFIAAPESTKLELSSKLSAKLGIPFNEPGGGPLDLSTNRLWLSLTESGENELNEANLELVFGFRNTGRDPLTSPNEALILQWRKLYLEESWTSADYPLSVYTREGVVPGTPATYKSTWKPIIDPDTIGLDDIRYFAPSYIYDLYRHRKNNTDEFLKYFTSDTPGLLSRTSADITGRRVRVINSNVAGDIVEENTVKLNNGSNWIGFTLNSRTTSGTNVDFQLANGASEPAMFQPDGTSPKMRYNRVQNVSGNTPDEPNDILTIVLPNSAEDSLSGGLVKLVSTVTGQDTVYDNASGTPNTNKIDSVVITEETVVINFNSGVTFPNNTYLQGMNFIYQKEVPLFTDIIPNPTDIVDDLFVDDNQEYPYLTPPVATPNPFLYGVWLTAGVETYTDLKIRYQEISLGIDENSNTLYIDENLHLSLAQFNRLMELFSVCEKYLESMYTSPRPTEAELYEMVSILRVSAKHSLDAEWVLEEIEYDPLGGAAYINLHLTSNNFWKSLTEPAIGSWDPSLQTIPNLVVDINSTHHPIVDPEYLSVAGIVEGPEGEIYRDKLNTRISLLEAERVDYLSWVQPYDFNGFTKILNKINTDDENDPFVLPSEYADLEELTNAVNSSDPFVSANAVDVVFATFRMTKDEYLAFIAVKNKYENVNPALAPTLAEINKAIGIGVKGYKKLQFYLNASTGWIEEEIDAEYKYYNIIKMNLAPGRGFDSARRVWQSTLENWSRQPFVDPDIVPAENIINFVVGNDVHDAWVNRLQSLETNLDAFQTDFNNTLSLSAQQENYQTLICTVVLNASSGFTAIDYFTELKTREENGEDIRPRLNQLNTTITEYRYLRKVYDVVMTSISAPLPLLQSEYQDVYDIFVNIEKKTSEFSNWVLEEYQDDIILSGKEFRNYQPAINTFPLTELPAYNTWRSPYRVRRDWLNLLEERNEREQTLETAWKQVVIETEDITLHVLRDALITAMTYECETFDHAAERLAKTLFIETKDNCCVRHTRVSQAIETIQGFLFALKNGIYDEYIEDFSLHAPNFDEEWEWLGSYAAWRSAVFVYLFPENLLYPTLKRYQSPGFRKLAKSIQESSRINPTQACVLAQTYEDYFTDILNLDVKFSTVATTTIAKDNVDICCDDPYYDTRVTFFFGQNPDSKRNYWSAKIHSDNSGYGHGFWEELPFLGESVQLVGAFPFAREHDQNGNPKRRELWLFYTFIKEGTLKFAYINKNLKQAGSNWSDPTETDDLPESRFGKAVAVTACQNTIDWDWASFIVSYSLSDTSLYNNNGEQLKYFNLHVRYFDNDGTFDIAEKPISEPPTGNLIFMRSGSLPITAIRHATKSSTDASYTVNDIFGYSIIFNNEIVVRNFAVNTGTLNRIGIELTEPASMVGAFQLREYDNTIVLVYKTSSNETKAKKITFTGNNSTVVTYTGPTTFNYPVQLGHFISLCPVFSPDHFDDVYFAINGYSDAWMASKLPTDNTQFLTLADDDIFSLTPDNTVQIPIQSGHCVADFLDRKISIEQLYNANMNAPQGTPVGNYTRTPITQEYLNEAYYFAPMLIALDQQQRGQFESALDWYRTVYDYTQNVTTNRKIFVGLELEENLVNVFSRPANWLLDPLNPHLIANTRANAYTRYTVTQITQCLIGFADREFTTDTVETVPNARKLYTAALELLQIDELNLADNACYITAHCFPDDISFVGTEWSNLFTIMQNELATLSDPDVLLETRDDIIAVFENNTLSTEEQFAEAFELIITAQAGLVTIPPTVGEVLEGSADRFTVAMEFLEANTDLGDNTPGFDNAISNAYAITISEISGLSIAELNNNVFNDAVVQLGVTDPAISSPYNFRFTNATGEQQMQAKKAYSPMAPTFEAYRSNLQYSNVSAFTGQIQALTVPHYTPLIDYQFCIPKNPVYDSLKMKINLELYKILNCRNIAGMVRELEVYAAPTDSATGVPVIGANGSLVLPALNAFKPSQYRFSVLIQRAKELVSQTQQIEAQFLSAMEKRDAEYYSLMRAKQDLQTAKSTIKLQDLRIRQAEDEKYLATLQTSKSIFSQARVGEWIAEGYNGWEIASIALLESAVVFQGLSTAASFAGASLEFANILNPDKGTGFVLLGGGFAGVASTLSTQASVLSQIASYERRAEEWQYQYDLAGFDIQMGFQQQKIADDNVRIVSQEREIAQLNADHANDTLEFLKNKFTNAELYAWMSNVLEGVYAYMLNLSTAMARTAEGQLYFERQKPAGPFILDDYWESPSDNYAASATGAGNADRRGLTGSARLLQDITRLDQFAFDTNQRKLQLTKTISLAQLFPEAFQRFRVEGVLNFELTNQLFDYDFPGHYLRLIKSVKTSVIGLVPVYGGIKASLTAGNISYVVIENNTQFQRISINRMENDTVALTSPTNATGLFEMQPLNNEMLNPFEGMGVESQWEFRMPRFSNRMDFDQVADVLITIEYTALDSFMYRTLVLNELNNQISSNRAFSFKNNFPDQWYELANAVDGINPFEVSFQVKRPDFPAGLNIDQIQNLALYFVRADGFEEEITIAEFSVTKGSSTAVASGTTFNGMWSSQSNGAALISLIEEVNTEPLLFSDPSVNELTWKLKFVNDVFNRELFSKENVKDILFVITYKAELPIYG